MGAVALQAGCSSTLDGGDDSLLGTGGAVFPGTGGWVSAGGTGSGGDVLGTGGSIIGAGGTVLSSGGSLTGSGGSDVGTGGTGGSTPNGPGQPTLPDGRGATVHFVTYEAENMMTNGFGLGPSRVFTEVPSEASGRRLVRLDAQGEYVKFTNGTASNSIVLRYSIPDGGADYWTTITVLVNGEFRTKLNLTSRYSWTYGNDSHFNKPDQNNPALGVPHHFFDETRALVGDIPVGATVEIRKDSGDNASHYDIDLVEMEQVGSPLGRPDGYLSITDCGATANDSSDDSNAIQTCIDQARSQNKGLYIPAGVFRATSGDGFSVGNVTIRGAGMWHSTIQGYFARFDCWENNCKYYDFSVFGDTTQRIDDSPETAFSGNGSSNVVLENIWIEHEKVGYWTGPNTNNLRISSCRMRNLHADAVNFYAGTSNSIVENTHTRNTGDDALAMWAHNTNGYGAGHDNVFRHNYMQLPWKANCIGLYGGSNNKIEDNVCSDVVQYPGILLARQFNGHSFGGTNRIDRNTLFRAGGWAYGQAHGAIKFHADQGPLQNFVVTALDIVEPTNAGVHVQGQSYIDSVWLNGVTITNPGYGSFYLNAGSEGSMDAVNVVATGNSTGVINDSNGDFNLIKGSGSSGW